MSEERGFQVGDAVEVLPAPEEAGSTWRMVGRRQGTVKGLDTRRPCSRTVGVLFRDGSVYFCNPTWLRRVERWEDLPRTFDVDGDWYVAYGNVRLRLTEDGKPLRYQAVPHDAPSASQDARPGPSAAKPDSQGGTGGSHSGLAGATWNVLYTTNIPRFKEGDAVWYRSNVWQTRHVTEVSVAPRYRLDGGDTWVREEDLRRVEETGG